MMMTILMHLEIANRGEDYNCILGVLSQSKLDDYQVRKDKGETLNQDQLVSWLFIFLFTSSCFLFFLFTNNH